MGAAKLNAVEDLPRRTNLGRETAITLKRWIATGLLKETLPGERELKARLGVGRNTLRQALEFLALEGWVSAARHGQVRRLEKRGPSAAEEGAGANRLPVTVLASHSPLGSEVLVELEELRNRLEEQGRRLEFLAPATFRFRHPEGSLERLVRAHPSAAWVLHVASEPMQRWFDRQRIRAFLFGSPYPGVRLPFLISDWEAAAFHAGVQLLRRGHRVIGVLEYQERFPGILAAERGLQRAIASSPHAGRLVVFKDEFTPVSVARSLELAFSLRERPTALVCTRSSQLLTCLSWLGSRGISYPETVSVVSLTSDTWFKDLYPAVSYYRTNPALIARDLADRVMELVAMGRVARKSLCLPMEYVPGGTIGPARGR